MLVMKLTLPAKPGTCRHSEAGLLAQSNLRRETGAKPAAGCVTGPAHACVLAGRLQAEAMGQPGGKMRRGDAK